MPLDRNLVREAKTNCRRTFNIWINDTLSVRYARLPQMSVPENMIPMGTIARLQTNQH